MFLFDEITLIGHSNLAKCRNSLLGIRYMRAKFLGIYPFANLINSLEISLVLFADAAILFLRKWLNYALKSKDIFEWCILLLNLYCLIMR